MKSIATHPKAIAVLPVGVSTGKAQGPAASRAAVRELLERQHGVITRGQALACGLGQNVFDRRVRSGGSGPVQGSAFLRAVLAEVTAGIRSSREAEMKDLIERGGLPRPLFNARLYSGDELIAIADTWWPEAGLIVEVDSREWHLSPKDWEDTMSRHAKLTALGILVLHFTPRQIRHEPEYVLNTIRQALVSRRDQPQLATLIRTTPATG